MHLSRRLPCGNINETPGVILGKMLQRHSVCLRIYAWFMKYLPPPLASAGVLTDVISRFGRQLLGNKSSFTLYSIHILFNFNKVHKCHWQVGCWRLPTSPPGKQQWRPQTPILGGSILWTTNESASAWNTAVTFYPGVYRGVIYYAGKAVNEEI